MMEERKERLLRAIGGVGGDLIDAAEKRRFAAGPLRRLLPMAACLALLAGVGLLVLPWFQGTKEETARIEETVAEQEQPEQPEQPGQEELAEEMPAEDEGITEQPAAEPKERLVVLGTVYYVEAFYTDEEAADYLGQRIGTVEQSDRTELAGEQVFMKKDCSTQLINGKQVPLEIFVMQEKGYLYCLTYYAQAGPLLSFQEVLNQLEGGEGNDLRQLLAVDMPCFGEASELAAEDLLQCFLLTLKLERDAGNRTEDLDRYLWLEEDAYVIPTADVTRQLDRYLEGYEFKPEQWPGYDPQRQALILEELTPRASVGVLVPTGEPGWGTDGTVVWTYASRVAHADSTIPVELRNYVIRFTDSGWIYESIYQVEE